jgi:isoquinoline 1-oxidoreductase alpha subunit
MKLTINDQSYEIEKKDENRKLLWFLRDDLGLIGTRFGCGAGICGACTVLIDGQPTRSCITTLGPEINGKQIRTVEDLEKNGVLHPVQQAFIDEQAPQCGWCMSGQMMAAVALLERSPKPTKNQIEKAMTQNYCRCGCYVRLRRAVQKASTLSTQSNI